MYLLLRTNELLRRMNVPAAAHGCTCCCARTSCCGARMYLGSIMSIAHVYLNSIVRQHNFSYFRAQQQVHSCDSTTFHISVRSSRYIRATAQLFIFPCAAAGTFVRSSSSSVRSSRYIRAPQQLVRAKQQLHSCASAARSCAAAGTFVRSSRSFVRSRIVLLGHRNFPHMISRINRIE